MTNVSVDKIKVHLCDSCMYDYPDCPAEEDDVVFGNGKGNDNVICCNCFRVEKRTGRWLRLESGADMCSECRVNEVGYNKFTYCPNCGAFMGCEDYEPK